jgi:cytochrome c oxidase cbb3-type subunit 3
MVYVMTKRFSGALAPALGAALLLGCAGQRALAVEAKPVFLAQCASCHGVDGKAKTPIGRKLGVKDLTVSKTTDAEIEKQILEGKKDPAGKELMPSFKTKLKPEEIQALVAYVKGLRK